MKLLDCCSIHAFTTFLEVGPGCMGSLWLFQQRLESLLVDGRDCLVDALEGGKVKAFIFLGEGSCGTERRGIGTIHKSPKSTGLGMHVERVLVCWPVGTRKGGKSLEVREKGTEFRFAPWGFLGW